MTVLRDWFKPMQCKLFGHIDDKVVGRLDQVRCQRCGRKDPPDTTLEELKAWLEEREAARDNGTIGSSSSGAT